MENKELTLQERCDLMNKDNFDCDCKSEVKDGKIFHNTCDECQMEGDISLSEWDDDWH